MKIRDLFVKPINRSIQGVIKVGQDDDANVHQELEEYVVTRELKGHFDDFFAAYEKSIDQDTDEMGVWISGFFGSGKSHFLKILSYLLENRTVDGKTAVAYFQDKIHDQMTINRMLRAAQQPTDVVLFNIDSKAQTGAKNDENAIISVFLQVFNEMQGFSSTNFWIAEMERQLSAQSKYDAFQEAFMGLDNGHADWKTVRDQAVFKKNTIKNALVQVGFLEEGDAQGFIDQLTKPYAISIEKFADMVEKYIQESRRRVVFLVDEVGQFVGESTSRMLNLQTVVEDLGAATRGKAWVVVTSQQAINDITDKISGQDFSKIQGRFTTRINMSSANVDEVIRQRLLEKTAPAKQQLTADYDANSAYLKNVIDFDDGVDRKKFSSGDDFARNYPFVPYQFNLLQDVLTAVRTHGSDGKHLSEGARSMLSLFQESAEAVMDKDDTALVPFSLFFEGLKQFLDHTHSIVIQHALDNDTLNPSKEDNPFPIQVLKALFMVKYLDNFKATKNNIVTLMINAVDVDRPALEKKVDAALAALREQRFVEKNFDTYEFLTDAEQDVNDAINKQEASTSDLEKSLGDYIFGTSEGITNKYTYPKLKGRYNFTLNEYVDDYPIGLPRNRMSIRVVTPLDDRNSREEANLILLSTAENQFNLVIDLPPEDDYLEMLRRAVRINNFLLGAGTHLDDRFTLIQNQRSAERAQLITEVRSKIISALEDPETNIYVAGHKIESGKDFQGRLDDGLKVLVDNTYRQLSLIDAAKSASDISQLLDRNGSMAVTTTENQGAVQEVYNWLQRTIQSNPHVTLQAVLARFRDLPYGYIDDDVEWLVAKLMVDGKIQVKMQDEVLSPVNPEYTAQTITNYLTKKQYAEKISIQVKKDISPAALRDMKEIADKVFNKRSWSETQPDLMAAELKKKIQADLDILTSYERKDQNYPGHDLLQQGIQMFNKLLVANESDGFYKQIHAMYGDLLDWSDNMEDRGIKDFYLNQKQQDIWDNGLSDLRRFKASRDFLTSADLTQDQEKLSQLLSGNRAGHAIQEIAEFHDDFVEKFSQIMDDSMKQVTAEIEGYQKQAEERIANSSVGDAFKERRRRELTESIGRIKQEAAAAPDLTQLVAKPTAASALLTRITNKLEAEEKRLADLVVTPPVIDPGSGTGSTVTPPLPDHPDKPVPPIIRTKYIKPSQLPIAQEWSISNQEDVDRYVAELRQALLDQLGQDQITKFTL
ncbi:BREX system P-loop protein BrxC [Schleiferilactobacillus shenzhenensis]|uniref:Uncharacterized protein n=1 Tax=Schleiferilactobacillus shenzhenensis LY-73 TaxID=1231336 RepID=U4TQN9_9LACO|nr:BREX system P-loop protein BrxC [Schleiferilactobacillus shenzhenensis]ERL65760.1 hypothetical protein L248_1836 [Schleiferilactobacillus shenzhenensis LY-73]